MTKKIISIILILLMAFALFSVTSFAELLPPDSCKVIYDPGTLEVSNTIEPGTKEAGVDFTITSETFTPVDSRYVQIGWYEDYSGFYYDIGGTIQGDFSHDLHLIAQYEEVVTVNIPFTKTVKKGGTENPEAANFELEILRSHKLEGSISSVKVSGTTVSTNGTGDYDSFITITGLESEVNNFIYSGFAVREINSGLANWTYSDAVYYILGNTLEIKPPIDIDKWIGIDKRVDIDKPSDSFNRPNYSINIFYATSELDPDGNEIIYYPNFEIDPPEKMSFENTYTKTVTVDPEPPVKIERENPDTGDMSPLELAGATIVVGAVAVAIAVINRKKEKTTR